MKYHAHFDTFSGAAGDMLLAACLDAADSLPHSLQLGRPGRFPTAGADDDDKNSEKLLSRVVCDLEGGMPEMEGEFELTAKRVWRGTGRIAASKIDVRSVYDHEAAPVPGNAPREHRRSSSGPIVDDGEGTKEEPFSHDDTHDHSHAHFHHHSHSHGDDRSHDHEHSHNHSRSHDHGHDHQSGSKLRNLPQIKRMLQSAPPQHIPPRVAILAIEAFTALAHAEMHTHGAESVDQVHFHEVGAVDSIVDTVGTLLALHHLGVDLGGDAEDGGDVAVTCSPLPMGEGTVWTDHGLLPVPAPATMRLMVGMPTCPGPKGVTGELVTPTAAALLRVLTGVSSTCDVKNDGSYWRSKGVPGRPPPMIPRAVGVGAGSKDFERHPNVLRLILGEDLRHHDQRSSGGNAETGHKTGDVSMEGQNQEPSNDTTKVSELLDSSVDVKMNNTKSGNIEIDDDLTEQKPRLWDMHSLTHMQANIDDATPELLAHAIELLIKNGAIDAWVQPIVMKKGRPAHCLHCICRGEAGDANTGNMVAIQNAHADDASAEHRLLNVMFRHTTTLGIRIQRNIHRAALKRRFVEVQLPYADNTRDGKVDVKIGSLNNGEVVSVKAEFDQCKVVSEESRIPLKIVSSSAERLAWDHLKQS